MIIQNNKILRKEDFKNEKELQNYVETNMKEILGYQFISTEFTIDNYRLDSLGYDEENNTFIIVEYKNIKNNSLVDQGYAYLGMMLKRKEAFVLKYNNVTKKNKEIRDIDWSQSRIVFVSPVFSQRQINASEFQGMPFDLIKATKYENGIVEFSKIEKNENLKTEVAYKNNKIAEVMKEIKVYTEDDHLIKAPEKIKELYHQIKEELLSMGDIDIEYKKLYIAFKSNTNIVDLEIYNSKIIMFINLKKGKLSEGTSILKDISNVGHHGNGDYCIDLKSMEDFEKSIPYIKESLKINKK